MAYLSILVVLPILAALFLSRNNASWHMTVLIFMPIVFMMVGQSFGAMPWMLVAIFVILGEILIIGFRPKGPFAGMISQRT